MPDQLNFGDMEETMSEAFDSMDSDESSEPVEAVDDSDDTAETGEVGEADEVIEDSEGIEAEASIDDQEVHGDETSSDADKPFEPPNSWSEEEKETFLKLPRELQDAVGRRESERESAFTEKFQDASSAQSKLDALEQIIAPRRQQWAANGLTEHAAINQLLALSDMASSQPEEFIKMLAQNTNTDLANIVNEDSEYYGEEESVSDPALSERIGNIEKLLLQNQQAQQAQIQSQAGEHLDSFVNQKNETGGLKNPHYNKVEGIMVNLMQTGQANSLDEAYNQAIWIDPEVRDTLLLARDKRSSNGSNRKSSNSRANKAANVNKRGRGSSGISKEPPGRNFEETMSKAYDRVNA
jgi:hypothetical protein